MNQRTGATACEFCMAANVNEHGMAALLAAPPGTVEYGHGFI